MEETNETLKLKYKKKSKSEKGNLQVKEVCRCHHDKRYEKSYIVYEKKPFKRFRNTFCLFQITFKVFKVPLNVIEGGIGIVGVKREVGLEKSPKLY